MTEWTLSDKINDIDDNWNDFIHINDVKEFIIRLKEEITKDMENRNLRSEKTVLGQFNYRIDKLAGGRLVE